jgi:starvation-inducible DNA-binding protein
MFTHVDTGLTDEARQVAADLLLQYLSDSQVLANKTQGFHWNVRGPHFAALHAAFGEQYEALYESLDETAERMRMVGAYAPASLALYAERSQLDPGHDDLSAEDMLRWLTGDHERLVKWLRGGIATLQSHGDEGNADYLISRLRAHEKFAWLLRSSADTV